MFRILKNILNIANNYIELISQFLIYTKENVLIQNNSYYFICIIKRGYGNNWAHI